MKRQTDMIRLAFFICKIISVSGGIAQFLTTALDCVTPALSQLIFPQ